MSKKLLTCPKCHSQNIKMIKKQEDSSIYQCLDCLKNAPSHTFRLTPSSARGTFVVYTIECSEKNQYQDDVK